MVGPGLIVGGWPAGRNQRPADRYDSHMETPVISRSMRSVLFGLAVGVCVACPSALAQQSGVGPHETPRAPDEVPPIPEVRELLVTVGDTPVYADEIEPLPVAKNARVEEPGSIGFERWLNNTRKANLQSRVIQLLQARICEEQGIVSTEDEIIAVREFRDRQQQRRLEEGIAMRDGLEHEVNMARANGQEPPDEVLLELRRLRTEVAMIEKTLLGREPKSRDAQRSLELGERQFADTAIRSWKFTRLLHEKYGGKVLRMGPNSEPVEAYIRLFQEEQEADRLVFETDWARTAVIGAFESTVPQLVDPLPDAFEVPWWNSDLPADAAASGQ